MKPQRNSMGEAGVLPLLVHRLERIDDGAPALLAQPPAAEHVGENHNLAVAEALHHLRRQDVHHAGALVKLLIDLGGVIQESAVDFDGGLSFQPGAIGVQPRSGPAQ